MSQSRTARGAQPLGVEHDVAEPHVAPQQRRRRLVAGRFARHHAIASASARRRRAVGGPADVAVPPLELAGEPRPQPEPVGVDVVDRRQRVEERLPHRAARGVVGQAGEPRIAGRELHRDRPVDEGHGDERRAEEAGVRLVAARLRHRHARRARPPACTAACWARS